MKRGGTYITDVNNTIMSLCITVIKHQRPASLRCTSSRRPNSNIVLNLDEDQRNIDSKGNSSITLTRRQLTMSSQT